MVDRRMLSFKSWLPHLLQFLSVIGVLIGFSLKAEHRITVTEEAAKNTIILVASTTKTVAEVQTNQAEIWKAITADKLVMVRLVTIIDTIEKRHAMEDRKR
jgi:hypothetical protein